MVHGLHPKVFGKAFDCRGAAKRDRRVGSAAAPATASTCLPPPPLPPPKPPAPPPPPPPPYPPPPPPPRPPPPKPPPRLPPRPPFSRYGPRRRRCSRPRSRAGRSCFGSALRPARPARGALPPAPKPLFAGPIRRPWTKEAMVEGLLQRVGDPARIEVVLDVVLVLAWPRDRLLPRRSPASAGASKRASSGAAQACSLAGCRSLPWRLVLLLLLLLPRGPRSSRRGPPLARLPGRSSLPCASPCRWRGVRTRPHIGLVEVGPDAALQPDAAAPPCRSGSGSGG